MNNNYKLITSAFTYFFIENYWEFFENDELLHVLKKIDINRLSDTTIVDNTYIRNVIDWDLVPRQKLIRCAARLIDNQEKDYVINVMKLPERNIKVNEAMHIIKRIPEIVDILNIELEKINQEEAYDLLLLGVDIFIHRIDVSKYNFDHYQAFNISKAYKHQLNVLKRLSYSKFNNLQVSEILAHKGLECVKLFDTTKLTILDWIYILERRPEFYETLDPIIFFDGDAFHLVQVMELIDHEELHVMMKYKCKELTAYGIERLLISFYDYVDKVDLSKLNESNIAKIRQHHPHFLKN
jgi:hypothetical protein